MKAKQSVGQSPGYDAVAVANSFTGEIRAREDEIDRSRRLPDDLAVRMRDAGLFRLIQPKRYHGLEVDLLDFFEAMVALGRANGSAAWNVMVLTAGGAGAAYMPEDVANKLFTGPEIVRGGVGIPGGAARPVEGGVRISGRWPFGSGCQVSTHLLAACILQDANGQAVLDDNGQPSIIWPSIAAADVVIDEDSWRVIGMQGSGSHDYVVEDVFVEEGNWSTPTFGAQVDSPLYKIPSASLGSFAIGALAIGIAEHAVELFVDLAKTKTPVGSATTLAMHSTTQSDLGRAIALCGSAKAYMQMTLQMLRTETQSPAEQVAEDSLVTLRLATTDAVWRAAEAVDLLYNQAATTAIFDTHGLQRCFRDIHVVTSHFICSQPNYEAAGRNALGLESGMML